MSAPYCYLVCSKTMTKLAKLALALLAELFDNKPTVKYINYCYLSDVVENGK